MKFVKYTAIIMAFLLTTASSTFATHIIGGNFDVCQVGPNSFEVTLRVYRDCNPGNSTSVFPSSINVYDNVTNANVSNFSLSSSQVGTQTPIILGDSCYSPTGVCVEEYIFQSTITLADNPNGYYLTWGTCCRNGLTTNADVGPSTSPSAGSMFYVQIPDPALAGGNCSPTFFGYPTDGYFCLSNDANDPYIIDPGVLDADGDSLVFSLVNPYDDGSTTKPFQLVGWQAGHSVTNLLGNTTLPNMTIDSQTGIITCFPENIGVYVFAILVEEYRNGVKIGETVRDVQYSSLACTIDEPPTINLEDTVTVTVGSEICIDMYVSDADGTDTLWVEPTSTDFNLLGNYVPPVPGNGGFYYLDFNGQDTLTVDHYVVNGTNTLYEGVGAVPLRYCWTPDCESIDEVYNINLLAYSIGCAGSDTSQKDVAVAVVYDPPLVVLNIPDSLNITFGDEICLEIAAEDTTNSGDTLYMGIQSPDFDIVENYVVPQGGGNQYYYTDFQGQDTVFIQDYVFAAGFAAGGVGSTALRYCWSVDCDQVFLQNFQLDYTAYSSSCGSDTIYKTTQVQIDPPTSAILEEPNIFTPNGDGENDVFKLRGDGDPCTDSVQAIIYNRWGRIVREFDDPQFEWDGTNKGGRDCSEGVYYVILKGQYGSIFNPSTGLNEPIIIDRHYTVQLMR